MRRILAMQSECRTRPDDIRPDNIELRYGVVVGHMTAKKMLHLCTDEMHDYPCKNFRPNSAADDPSKGFNKAITSPKLNPALPGDNKSLTVPEK